MIIVTAVAVFIGQAWALDGCTRVDDPECPSLSHMSRDEYCYNLMVGDAAREKCPFFCGLCDPNEPVVPTNTPPPTPTPTPPPTPPPTPLPTPPPPTTRTIPKPTNRPTQAPVSFGDRGYCNGIMDPEGCAGYTIEKCENHISAEQLRISCPALCETCITTTPTSTATTTATSISTSPTSSHTSTATFTQSSTATSSASSTPTTTATSTGTTAECPPFGDIVYLFDISTSIKNDELNEPEVFDCFTRLASETVASLQRTVQKGQFQVAAMTFADTANIVFDFDDFPNDRHEIKSQLNKIAVRYPKYGSTESDTNLYLALQILRTKLMTPERGYADKSRPVILVVLSDGQMRTNPSSNAACAGMTDFKRCGAKLLATELSHPAYDTTINVRWAFGTPSSPALHDDLKEFRADQLALVSAGSFIYTPQMSACNSNAPALFANAMLNSEHLRQCGTTPTSTMTTTGTTTPTTDECSRMRADIVFVFDLSSSVEDTQCSNDEFRKQCPGYPNEDVSPNVCLAYDFALGLVERFGPSLHPDGVRIAAVTFSDDADVLMGGKFVTTAADARAGLEALGTMDARQPTRAATALELLQTKYFADNSDSGYRHGRVPLVVVMVTDARSLNSNNALESLLGQSPLAEATRMLFSAENSEDPFPGQIELLGSKGGKSQEILHCEPQDAEWDQTLCGGVPDPLSCVGPSRRYLCQNNFVSESLQTDCPILCNTCTKDITFSYNTLNRQAVDSVLKYVPESEYVVFLVDTSTSIKNAELNDNIAFDCFQRFASTAVSKLGRLVQEDRFHVAAITFDDEAKILFDFNNNLNNRDKMISSLRNLPYSTYGASSESHTNLHLALKTVRTDLMTPGRGYVDSSRPIVLVVLSDGEVRADPAANVAVCAGIANAKECGAKLLAAELMHPIYNSTISLRWVYGTPATATLHKDVRDFRAAQLESLAFGSEVYASGVLRHDACYGNAATEFADWMLNTDSVRQCDTTQTTTATTTPTTTLATTACNRLLADVVFVFDLSSSIEDSSCSVSSIKTHCPGYPSLGSASTSTCLAFDLAAGIVQDLGSEIAPDGVRIAAVTFSDDADVLMGGKFVTTAADARAGLEALGTMDARQPTRAATALELLQTKYFADNSDSGYRHGRVPLVVVMVTDARSLNSNNELNMLLAQEPLQSATRLVLSNDNAEKPFPGQLELLASVRENKVLSCKKAEKTNNSLTLCGGIPDPEECHVYHNEDICRNKITGPILEEKCPI
eukprot:gene16219-9452_t